MKLPSAPRTLALSALFGASLLIARATRAEEAGIGVRYRAPADCPSEEEFLAQARQRNPRLIAARTPEPAISVSISAGGSAGFSGRLERATSTGMVGVREISAATCQEAATALALIAALTGDLVDVPPRDIGEPDAAQRNAIRPAPVEVSPIGAEETPPASAAPAPSLSRVRWQAGADAALLGGVTPSALAGGGVFAEAAGRSSALWVPSARLSLAVAESSWSSSVQGSAARAKFVWMAASLDGCPLQVGNPLGISAKPCARLTTGRLNASGSGRPSPPRDEGRLWIDVGGLVRGRAQLGRTIFVEADAEVFVPLTTYEFDFENQHEVAYLEPRVGYRFGAGLGWLFR